MPLAERLMFSLALEPLNCNVSWPPWPSTTSLPSPGFQTKVSSPAPRKADVVAATADDGVVAVAADQHVVAVAAGDGVIARAAIDGEGDQRGQAVACGEDVVAAVGVDDQVFAGTDVEGEGGRRGAVEADPSPVGGDGEVLGAVAAVDLDGVDAGPTLIEVTALAGVPDHPVVAGLSEDLIISGPAGQNVVARTAEEEIGAALAQESVVSCLAEELVIARAAGQDVVAIAAEEICPRQCAVGLVQGEIVVAGPAEHLDQAGVGDGGVPAFNLHGAAVHQDVAGRVAADGDGVVHGIADDRQHALCGGRTSR